MIDLFGRKIETIRIAVTDRCNLRCQYCMPAENAKFIPQDKLISFDEIIRVAQEAISLGIINFRLTGGEPLLRQKIVKLVERLANLSGINEISMTTNGTLLAQYAKPLYEAGLQRVNISLDTIDSERFFQLTRGGDVQKVFAGIDAALEAGLYPIKLNCVVNKSSSEIDAKMVEQFSLKRGIKVRFIKLMRVGSKEFSAIEGGNAGNCVMCNRIRLLCDGTIRPCLFSSIGFNIREYGIKEAFLLAIKNKPISGNSCLDKWMYSIGG